MVAIVNRINFDIAFRFNLAQYIKKLKSKEYPKE